ncbi:MAG: DUF58 domain-containing protein [Clostridia bacterium]|nr:DUF58 domain-containing protein [Clostridia bacterium]
MTARAVFALLFGGGMLLFSLLTGSRAAFVPGLMALALLSVALLSCLAMLLTLRFTLHASPAEAERGQTGTLVLSLRAHALLPCAPLVLTLSLPGAPEGRYIVDMRPWGQSLAHVSFVCPHVGSYTLTASRPLISDCFGFFRIRSPHRAQRCGFLILPAPARLSLPESRNGEAARPGPLAEPDPDAPEGLRDWREGDELKRIHWKLSLRRGTFTVRTHEALRRPNTVLLLSCRLPEGTPVPGDLTDRLCEAAAGVVRRHIARGGALRLCLPQGQELSMPVIRPADLPVFCRALAGARFGAPEQTAQRLLSAAGSICPADAAVLVTAVLDARTADALITLRASGASVFLLLCGAAPDGKLAARLQAAGVALIAPDEKEAGQP